jgi:hypothetical protein
MDSGDISVSAAAHAAHAAALPEESQQEIKAG